MSWGSDIPEEQPKDYTKWVWGGIFVVVAVLLAATYFINRPDPNISTVRARHILITFDKDDPRARAEALQTINDLRKRIVNGEDFKKLAKEYSDDPTSAMRGGDLGYYRRGSFVPNFEDYVWSAPIGQLSDVIETENGFHLIEVLDRRLSKVDAYNEKLKEKTEVKGNEAGTESSEAEPAPQSDAAAAPDAAAQPDAAPPAEPAPQADTAPTREPAPDTTPQLQ